MKVIWSAADGFPIAAVEHLIADDAISAWPVLVKHLGSKMGVDSQKAIILKLMQHFSAGPDVRSVYLNGSKVIAKSMCPASAWLFNHQFEKLLAFLARQPSNPHDEISKTLKGFGFDINVSRPKENGFLQAARSAGFDIIRSSTTYPKYVIRNQVGDKISVLQQFTDRTSQLGTQTSTNKLLAAEILSLAALPTPKTFGVFSGEHAIKVFKHERFRSAVLKPCNTDRGLGVHTGLATDKELFMAFNAASKYGKVILQEHIPGDDFRILVVDGTIMGVTQRKPLTIVGNGNKSVRELIIEKMKWRANHPFYRNFNNFSSESQDIKFMLQKQGFNFDSVLNEGRHLVLRSNANVSSGGEHVDVTERCHEDVKQLALDCAELFCLDVAGIDYLSPNITVSWRNANGAICEVNPTPAMSVDGVPEKIFDRFNTSACASSLKKDVGDVIYIKDCTCNPTPDLRKKFNNFHFFDLRDVTEKQYFFQSFLTARPGRYFCISTSQILFRYGFVNSNVREIIICANCMGHSDVMQNFSNSPFDFKIKHL